MARPEVEVRRYVEQFLHGKAYLFGDGRRSTRRARHLGQPHRRRPARATSSSASSTTTPPPCGQALEWFDAALGATPRPSRTSCAGLLFPDPGLVDPETVYLRALLELYGDELDEPLPAGPVRTGRSSRRFQRDGYERARRILADHGGVVYADGVGTGKTEIGLAFIEEYALRARAPTRSSSPPRS